MMKTALKAAMLVIAILFLSLTLLCYGQVASAGTLVSAVRAGMGFVGSATLTGLCLVAYAILRRETDPEQ